MAASLSSDNGGTGLHDISADPQKPFQFATATMYGLSLEKMDDVCKYMMLNPRRYRENIQIPTVLTPPYIKTREEKMVQAFFESCPFKAGLSGIAGKNPVIMLPT